MKRTFALLTALILAALVPQGARAAGTEISVNAPSGSIRAGESFTVTVDVSGNPGFCAVQFILAFDQDALSCSSASSGTLLTGVLSAVNPEADAGAILGAASVDPVQGDGTLGTFQFTAKKDLENPGFRLEDVLLADVEGEDFPYQIRQRDGQTAAPQPSGSGQEAQPSGTGGDSQTAEPRQPSTPQKPAAPQQPAAPEKPAAPQAPENPAQETAAGTAETPLPDFIDLKDHWAAEQIREAAARGLVSGYSDGSFRPGVQVNRGQMAVILWRLAGKPQPEGTAPFTDLDGVSGEFRSAITWGYEKGLLNGVSATAYAPGEGLSRQAAMKLLRGFYSSQAGPEAMVASAYDGTFTDSGDLSSWAREPVYWGVYHGIMTGTTPTTLSPRSGVNRAQLAVMLTRCLDRFDL